MELTPEEVEKISEIAVSSANDFIFSKVSKKEVVDVDINVELHYNEVLNVDISIDIIFDDLSSADVKIADDAVDYVLEEIEKFLAHI